MTSNLLSGKKGLIMGLANAKSIAWGIAHQCSLQEANLALSYQGEALYKRVRKLGEQLDSPLLLECDVKQQSSIQQMFEQIKKEWGSLDFIVHAIAFSDKEELKGRYVDTSPDNFLNSMHISCYSFTNIAKYASKLMHDGGSMITLTYYGAEKAIPNYNVMGVAKAALESSVQYIAADLGPHNIRVNAISAGPIKTLAASGISDFRSVLEWTEQNAPLRRNIDRDEVGKTAVYLASDLSSAVTGEIIHVDSGYHTVGMKAIA